MKEADKELLHKQAQDQAEKFEILNKRDVASMSRVRQPPIPLSHLIHCQDVMADNLFSFRSSELSTSVAITCVRLTSLCGLVARNFMAA